MGTRAIITKNGYPILSIQYDGDPYSLGSELRATVKDKEIYRIADEHRIVYADSQFLLQFTKERHSNIHGVSEYFDYQYDLNEKEWRFRKLNGRWPNPTKGNWMIWLFMDSRWNTIILYHSEEKNQKGEKQNEVN